MKKDTSTPEEEEEDDKDTDLEDRTKEWSKVERVKNQLGLLYTMVEKAFDDKNSQKYTIERCWDIYHCKLGDSQKYRGTHEIFLPIVFDAIEARVTRFTNVMFPPNNRYADVVTTDGSIPYETIALLDYYVKVTRLRDVVCPALVRTGDITGQYALYVSWLERKRHTVQKVEKAKVEMPGADGVEGVEKEEDIKDVEVVDSMPDVMVLDPREFVVLPATVDEVDDAEVVAIALRWTEARVKQAIDEELFDRDAGEQLLANFGTQSNPQQSDPRKAASEAAGVQVDAKGSKTALIYQVWSKLKLKKGERRSCVTYFGSENLYLSCKRNPYWNDRVPVLSQAALKESGSFWGKSRVQRVEQTQYAANDAVNMGLDSAQFSMMPITMTDPEKNPRVGSMVLDMAAVWMTSPNDTQFVSFPQLWKDALQLVGACRDQIMQSLGTNPAMIPNSNTGKKPTQAQVAQEQQVALESTADVVSILETSIFSRLLQWFYELDYQYRKESILVRKFGTMGIQAQMQEIPPIQVGARYEFSWYGSEGTRSVQQVQQMISGMNILRGIPPEQLNGRKLDIAPVLEHVTAVVFGPKLAPHVLIDQSHQLSVPAGMENLLLDDGFLLEVHPNDNDIEHIAEHMADIKTKGDEKGNKRMHVEEHLKAFSKKTQAAAGQSKGSPGTPGGGLAPGMPGLPAPGAQPAQQRPAQQPPGAVAKDAMATMAPRKGVI
jgi:hypothetical protein